MRKIDHFGSHFQLNLSKKWITPGAMKQLKSSHRTHLFEFLNYNPFSERSLWS